MLKKVSQATLFSVTLALGLSACQAAEDSPGQAQEGGHIHSNSAVSEQKIEHSSEAVVGPDEAFFASVYLEQIFRYSKVQAKPDLNSNLSLKAAQQPLNAFEFEANFSESRLQIMALTLLALGDSDQNQLLSEQEFLGLRLKPEILGVKGDSLSHSYSRDLFVQLAGESGELGTEEIKSLLRGLGPSLKQLAFQKGDKEQRLLLMRAWDQVLKTYDKDQDGSINSAEQRALRQERMNIVARLQG